MKKLLPALALTHTQHLNARVQVFSQQFYF